MQKGDSEKSPWRAPFLPTKLEDVAKLELADAATINIADVEIARVEAEIDEGGVGHITCARRELGCIEHIEVIKANLEPVSLRPKKACMDRFRQAQIQAALSWPTQDIATGKAGPNRFAD